MIVVGIAIVLATIYLLSNGTRREWFIHLRIGDGHSGRQPSGGV